ncbi:MAG: acetylglutamate kinase [Chloroflexi bacterium]|nr:MAG: acetylglutamate kinase [Chloroflexota bacterium]RLT31967.1 MAG: acetylglutamate kinase [Chloroflexota bacterium]
MTTLRVIKIGGNDIDDPAFVQRLVTSIAAMQPKPVIVHGGGKEIGQIQQALGGEPRFVAGLRVSDETAMAAAEMVLAGAVNTRLVVALGLAGVDAVGMSGVDRGLIRVRKLVHPEGDLGRVGQPIAVRTAVLWQALDADVVPVVAPISLGDDGSYNVNADDAAGAIAAALAQDRGAGAVEVTFVTNVPGVKLDGVVVAQLDASAIEAAIASGAIYGGMIPKVKAALAVLDAGAAQARIVDMAGLEQLARGDRAGTIIVTGGRA